MDPSSPVTKLIVVPLVNTCCDVRSWILRLWVCATHFFQAQEFVGGLIRYNSPRHPLCLSHLEISTQGPASYFVSSQSRKRKLGAQLCQGQTPIRTPLDHPTLNGELARERRNGITRVNTHVLKEKRSDFKVSLLYFARKTDCNNFFFFSVKSWSGLLYFCLQRTWQRERCQPALVIHVEGARECVFIFPAAYPVTLVHAGDCWPRTASADLYSVTTDLIGKTSPMLQVLVATGANLYYSAYISRVRWRAHRKKSLAREVPWIKT